MKLLFTLCMLFLVTQATAQPILFDSVNRKREKIGRTGTIVLGSWALLNLGAGLAGQVNATGERKEFHRFNTAWGGVNLALAGIGFFGNRFLEGRNYTVQETFKKQAGVEKLFLFNTALDLGYIAFGFYTKERALRFTGNKQERLVGRGQSLIIQGSVLAVFDGVMYLVHAKNGKRLHQTLSRLSIGAGEHGFGLLCRF